MDKKNRVWVPYQHNRTKWWSEDVGIKVDTADRSLFHIPDQKYLDCNTQHPSRMEIHTEMGHQTTSNFTKNTLNLY